MSGLNINLSSLLSAPAVPDVQLAADFDLETARSLFQTRGGAFYFHYAANPFLQTLDLARTYVQGTAQKMEARAMAYVATQTHIAVVGNSEEWLVEFRRKMDLKLTAMHESALTLDHANGPLAPAMAAPLDIGRAPLGDSVYFLEGDTLYFSVTCTFPYIKSLIFQVNLTLVPRIEQAAVPASLGALRDVFVYVTEQSGVVTVAGVDYDVTLPEEELNTDPALQFGRRGDKIVVYSLDSFTATATVPGLAATGKGYVSYAVTSAVEATVPTTPLWTSGVLVNLENTEHVGGKLVIHQPEAFTLVDERNRDSSAAYAALGFERLRSYRAAPYIDLYQCANRAFDAATPFKLNMQMGQLPSVSPLQITADLCGEPYEFNYVGEPGGAYAALVADPYIGVTEEGLVAVIAPTTMTSPQIAFEPALFIKAVYSVVSSYPVNAYPTVSPITFLGNEINLAETAEEMAAAINQIAGFYCSVQAEPPYSFLQIQSLNAFSTGIWAAAGFPESRDGILTSPVLMSVRLQVFYENNSTAATGSQSDSTEYWLGGSVTVKPIGNVVNGDTTFLGWNTAANGTGTSYAPAATFVISNNTTLYAQWGATVSYSINAVGSGSQEDSAVYLLGTSVSVKTRGTMVNDPQYFVGWNTAADGSGEPYAQGAALTIFSNTILYAQWVSGDSLRVIYDANSNAIGSQSDWTVYLLNELVLVKTSGSLENGTTTFMGWNTAADGTGTSYAAGATFAISSFTILYAQWGATVTYNKNATAASGSQTDSTLYLLGTSVTAKTVGSMANAGFTFLGWNTAADGTGASYAPNASFVISNTTNLYAQWGAVVTYNKNGTSAIGSQTDTTQYILGAQVTVKNKGTMLNGVNKFFMAWNTASNGSGVSYAPNDTFLIFNNTILYAQWGASNLQVTYNKNATSAAGYQTDYGIYDQGATVIVLSKGSMVNGSLTFLMWNTAANGTGTSYAPNSTFVIANNTTLYAIWSV